MLIAQIPAAHTFQYQKNNFILSQDIIAQFYEDGFLVIENVFSQEEITVLNGLLLEQLKKNEMGGGLVGHYIT